MRGKRKHRTGWGEDASLDKLLLEIWARVFPEELRSALSANDFRKLNSALRIRDKQKTHHHCVPQRLRVHSKRFPIISYSPKPLGEIKAVLTNCKQTTDNGLSNNFKLKKNSSKDRFKLS